MKSKMKIDWEGIKNKELLVASKMRQVDIVPIIMESMKEAVKQALPLILEHVAERADTRTNDESTSVIVDKESITSQEEEILKLLGIE